MTGEAPDVIAGSEGSKALSHSQKSVKKRDAILRAAIEVINTKSFALATMSEIAAKIGLRDAALYYYFPNKQALAFACHLRSLQRFEYLLKESDRRGRAGAEKLELLLRDLLIDSAKSGPPLYFGDLSYLTEVQREEVSAWGQRLTDVLERFVKEGIDDGSIVPCETELVVQLLLGMLIWLARWVPNIEGVTADRLMTAMGLVTLKGLAPRPSA